MSRIVARDSIPCHSTHHLVLASSNKDIRESPNMPKRPGSTRPSPLLEGHRKALHLLEKKVSGCSVEGDHLDDLFNYKPEELPGVSDNGEKRPYFTRPISVNGQRKRRSEFGRWKAYDGKQEIRDLKDRPLGSVQRLNYYNAVHPEKRAKWTMTEYTLDSSRIPPGVNELTLCIIYWTKDRKRNETPSDDVGPSSHPSSEPVVQAEDQVVEHTDLHFLDQLASMEFPMDLPMAVENDPWFKGYYGQE